MFRSLLALFVGLGVGLLSGIVGIGGGTIFVPVLLFFYGFDIHAAVSTSILAIAFTVTSSYLYYARRVKIRYRLGTLLELSTIPGAVIGSYMSNVLDRVLLEVIFSVALLLSSVKLIYDSVRGVKRVVRDIPLSEMDKGRLIIGLISCFVAGFVAGSVGISGGSVKTPILILVVDVPERIAIATSSYMMVLTTLAALVTHAAYGKIDYLLGAILGIGGFIGAQLGGRINIRLSKKKIRFILGVVLLLISLRILFDAVGL